MHITRPPHINRRWYVRQYACCRGFDRRGSFERHLKAKKLSCRVEIEQCIPQKGNETARRMKMPMHAGTDIQLFLQSAHTNVHLCTTDHELSLSLHGLEVLARLLFGECAMSFYCANASTWICGWFTHTHTHTHTHVYCICACKLSLGIHCVHTKRTAQ